MLTAAAGLASLATPAAACSVTRTNPGTNAEERMAGRADVRRVIGSYHIQRVDPDSFATAGAFHGRLTTRRGTGFDVVQPYREVWVACLVYHLPLADASGTFYLSRGSQGGEYELLDWTGDYVPAAAGTPSRNQIGEEGPQ